MTGVLAAVGLLAGCATPAPEPAPEPVNDYPTSARVLYVEECLREYPGPRFEMISKCACAVDAMARQVRYDDYTTMSTIVNAVTIGGERGGELRDNDTLRPQVRRYRELKRQSEEGCFLAKR